jgi:hypothetical protein
MEAQMKKDFVVFLSPGTFVSEETRMPIDSWDPDKAVAMSKAVTERYQSKPYGFYFVTKERSQDELDSKETRSSGLYFLGVRDQEREPGADDN